ncbi:hypothetical protein G6L37_35090 [Agrobacterium rubi]|nr:hypothetical protein [Agrobacterium rubi]NTF23796.1 hypothetical protein [Agrobacterium rubi]
MSRDLNFSLDDLKHVYVSSCRRGFMAISDNPMCITSESGSSGNHVIIAVKRVCREGGRWVYADPDQPGQWWLRTAWVEALALKGGEPWRVYEMDAMLVAENLDKGVFTDDIRGFKTRLEPWQPVLIDEDGNNVGVAVPSMASVWERTDGWRIVSDADGKWWANGSRCNADRRSTLKFSPNHFDPIEGFETNVIAEAMAVVDDRRPWI